MIIERGRRLYTAIWNMFPTFNRWIDACVCDDSEDQQYDKDVYNESSLIEQIDITESVRSNLGSEIFWAAHRHIVDEKRQTDGRS